MDEATRDQLNVLAGRTQPDNIATAFDLAASQGPPGPAAFWAQVLNGLEHGQSDRHHKTGADYDGWYVDELNPVTFASFYPSRTRNASNVYQPLVAKPFGWGANSVWVPLKFGAIVRVHIAVAGGEYVYYVLDPAAQFAPAPVLVTVAKDGGIAGDPSNDCSYTYTVKSAFDDATVIATGKTPERPRFPKTAYYYGGEGGRSNLGLWDPLGEDLLICFGEIQQTEVC